MVVVSVSTMLTPRYLVALLVSAFFGGAFVGIFHANAIGMSGPAFGLEAMALAGRRSMRAYFSGQDLALAVIAVPLLTLVSFGLAAVAGHPLDGFLAVAVDLAGIGAGLAFSNIFTAACPIRWRGGRAVPPTGARAGTWACRLGVSSSACSAWRWRSSRPCSP